MFKQQRISKDHKGSKELQLSQQQLSHVVASLLLMAFFIFMAGYYWGKRNTIEPISDSLADQVSYGFCSLYDFQGDSNEDGSETKEEPSAEALPQSSIDLKSHSQDVENNGIIEVKQAKKAQDSYYAQLFGANSLKRAQACAGMLKQRGFDVVVATRTSKTASGKEMAWYQVVTAPMHDKELLEEQVEQMKKIAKLKDVQIRKNNLKKNERP